MLSNQELCRKIQSIYPDIGECGIAVKVDYDDANNASGYEFRSLNCVPILIGCKEHIGFLRLIRQASPERSEIGQSSGDSYGAQ